jgi:hypothetical protein
MCSVISAARDLVERLHDVVSIPRNDALDVYSNNDLPRYTAMCRAHLPGYDGLSPHCKGVLFTLVLNRGASFDLPETRYAEMRGIKAAIRRGDLARVPALLRSMKRLRPDSKRPARSARERDAALGAGACRASSGSAAALDQVAPIPCDLLTKAHFWAIKVLNGPKKLGSVKKMRKEVL